MKHTYELCHGRHETGCDKAVFPSEVNPMDFDGMSHIVAQSVISRWESGEVSPNSENLLKLHDVLD